MHVKPPPHWICEVVKYTKDEAFCTYSESYAQAGSTTGAVMLDIQYLRKYRTDLYKKILRNDQTKRRGGISKMYFNGELDTTETDVLLNVRCLLSNIPDAYKKDAGITQALLILNDHLKNVDADLPRFQSSCKRKRYAFENHIIHMTPSTFNVGYPENTNHHNEKSDLQFQNTWSKTHPETCAESVCSFCTDNSKDLGSTMSQIVDHSSEKMEPMTMGSADRNSDDLESMILPNAYCSSENVKQMELSSTAQGFEYLEPTHISADQNLGDLGSMLLSRGDMNSEDLESMVLSSIHQSSEDLESMLLSKADSGLLDILQGYDEFVTDNITGNSA